MSDISVHCTGCGARLKASGGKAKIRCPGCGTVLHVSPAAVASDEEPVDQLEEVDEAPVRRRRDEEDDRPKRRRSRRPQPAWGEYLWVMAVGAAAVCFFISFGITLLAVGVKGLPEETETGAYLGKVGSLAFGVFAALAFVVMGAFSVKNREIIGRWGDVVRGPMAVILGTAITMLGGSVGGFVVYGLLLALIRGR